MIKTLILRNIQSHKRTQLDFVEGLNVIIGATDSGKSAILRGLRKLIYNRPIGNAYRSWWGGRLLIKLITFDNETISYKEDTEREYSLSTITDPFKAFGTEVPEEISKVLNLSEINLQRQLDSPFLLTISPGDVALHFNRIARLDQIDHGRQNIESSINQINSAIGREAIKGKPSTGLIHDLEINEKELIQYTDLDKFEADLEVLEDVQADMIKTTQAHAKLIELREKILSKEDLLEQEGSILKIETDLNAILLHIENRDKNNTQLKRLTHIVNQINTTQEELTLNEFECTMADDVDEILLQYKKLREEEVKCSRLQRFLISIANQKTKISTAEIEYKRLHDKFEKEFPDVCPLCDK